MLSLNMVGFDPKDKLGQGSLTLGKSQEAPGHFYPFNYEQIKGGPRQYVLASL